MPIHFDVRQMLWRRKRESCPHPGHLPQKPLQEPHGASAPGALDISADSKIFVRDADPCFEHGASCVVGDLEDGFAGRRPNDVINEANEDDVRSLHHDLLTQEDSPGRGCRELPIKGAKMARNVQREHSGRVKGCIS